MPDIGGLSHAVGSDEEIEVTAPAGQCEGIDIIGVRKRGETDRLQNGTTALVDLYQLCRAFQWEECPQLTITISGTSWDMFKTVSLET